MQENGKRLITAVGLALLVFLGYQKFFAKKPVPPPPGVGSSVGSGSAAGATVSGVNVPTAHAGDEAGWPTAKAPADAPVGPKLHFATFDVEFTNVGGAIAGWRLSDPRYGKSENKDEAQLLPVTRPGAASLQVNYRDADDKALIAPLALWSCSQKSDVQVICELDTELLHSTKTFTIVPDVYLVKLDVDTRFKQTAPREARVVVTTYGFQDPEKDDSSTARVQPRVWRSESQTEDGESLATSGLKLGTNGAADSSPRRVDHLDWTGFTHPYLMAVIAPVKKEGEASKHTEAILPTGLMRTDMTLATTSKVEAGTEVKNSLVAYYGPKNYETLDRVDVPAGFSTHLRDSVDFGHFPALGFSLAFVGKPLLWLLGQIYGFVGNWGVAIILLTILVKVITLFWTTRSMRSMKAMAALSPQMQELQKKYPNDKARAQQETMALYKQHGVSPLSGCAPMFLQVPIWSALYIMLSATGELYQEAFIPGWINDLTNTDPLHVLPVALVAMMFLQARLTPQAAGQPGAQKMMQYGMPLMFGVMSFYFPAGLTLYIFTNTFLSALHSLYMNRFDKRSLELAAQLKKNKEMVEARSKAEEEALARAKVEKAAGGGSKKKKTTSAGSIKALKETAETATEVPATTTATTDAGERDAVGDGDGDAADEADDDSADRAIGAPATTGASANRPRRKKRRR